MPTPTKFDHKENAYKYAQQLNDMKPGNFCPLLRATCRQDCQCWAHAWVKENKPYRGGAVQPADAWWVYAAGCENEMFRGGRFEL